MPARPAAPPSSSARSSPTVPSRSASTSCAWIVSKLTWRAKTKSPSARSGHRLEGALEREPDGVLDEAGLQVRVLDDEELVGPLQQLVDRRAHRALHDRDQVVRVELPLGADVERAAPALVVRRERDEVEDPLDVLVAGLGQPLGGAAADEPLRARAGVDPGRLDADDPAHAVGRRRRDPDERDHLLRRELADGRRPPHGPPRGDPRLGAQRALAADDVAGDVLGERLDVQRLGPDDRLDRLLEQLGEARHVHALLLAREVDRALDLRRPSPSGAPRGWTRIAFWTPVTPARVSDSRTSGEDAWRSGVALEISVTRLR